MKRALPWSHLLSAARLFCVGWACIVAWKKVYAIDEFYWAHRAWSVLREGGQGLLHALPFAGIELLYGPLALAAHSRPEALIWLRLVPLLSLMLFLAVAARWWRHHGVGSPRIWGGIFALLALNSPTAFRHSLEIRPDGPAWALLCAGIVIGVGRNTVRAWVLSCLCLLLSGMLTVKSMVVLLPLLPLFASDLRRVFLRAAPRFFPRPHWTLGLALLVLLPLLVSGAAAEALRGILAHERHYPARPWNLHLWPALREAPWLAALAVAGAVLLLRDLARAWRRRRPIPLRVVWLPLWIGAALSFLLQRAAFPYSLLPWWGTSCFLAVHALQWTAQRWRPRPFAAAPWLALALLALSVYGVLHRSRLRLLNEHQQATLRVLGRLTSPDDPVFDLSASFVFRPSASPRAFVDEAYRLRGGDALVRTLIEAIQQSGTTVFIPDGRFLSRWRNTELARHTETFFHPCTPDLYLYGQRWPLPGPSRGGHFTSPRDARYFLHADGVEDARLRVNGQDLVAGDIIALPRGDWPVELFGQPVGEGASIALLWLPADGHLWQPLRDPGYPLHARYILPH